MRIASQSAPPIPQAGSWAPRFIAVGLAMLLATVYWPSAPAVTGTSLIALGATFTTLRKLRSSAARSGLIALHLFVYLNLYLLFLGAICHAATSGPQGGLSIAQSLDLVTSVGVMGMAIRASLAALSAGEEASAG